MTLEIVVSLTDDTRSVNYDHNTFIIQATGDKMFGYFDRFGVRLIIFLAIPRGT